LASCFIWYFSGMKSSVITAPGAIDLRLDGELHPSAVAGVGVVRTAGEYRLVATRPILAGERLFRIEGELTHQPSRYSVQIGYNLHIDLRSGHTVEEIFDRYFWRFMNHSCEANALIREGDVVAERDIRPWEAVTFNYNTTEWEMAEPFICGCGSKRCLGRIQGYKFLTPAQRVQLNPVAPHLHRHLAETPRLLTELAPA